VKLIFALIALVVLFGCGKEPDTIRFGIMPSLDAIPMLVAEERGYFEAHGVSVELQPFYSAADRDAAFIAGELDGIIGDLVALGLYREGGLDVQATGATTGEFILLGNSTTGLKGQSIIISYNTATEMVLDLMLKAAGLRTGDITQVEVAAIPARLEMVREGQADSLLIPEPFATVGESAGLHRIATSSGMGFNPFITLFKTEAILEKEEQLRAFFAAYDQAVDYLNNTPQSEYIDSVIERTGFPEELQGILVLPVFSHNALPEPSDVQLAMEWLSQQGLISQQLGFDELISPISFP